jgi:hypothetical protein
MRNFIVAWWLALSITSHGQTFTVIKVAGNVTLASGAKVTVRQTLKASEKLIFETEQDYLIVISPETSRRTIKKVPGKKPYELQELLLSFITPDQRPTASRSAEMSYLHQLQSRLTHERLLILNPGRLSIDTVQLALKSPAGILAYTAQPGTKRVYRNIYSKGAIMLDHQSLLGENHTGPAPRVYLEYMPDVKEDPLFVGESIGSFVPIYPQEEKLKAEIKAIVDATPPNSILPEIVFYLRAEYGMPVQENLLTWLQAQQLIPAN